MDIYFSFKEIISAFMVLFAVIDILGAIPIIISLREKNQKIEAGKAAIISFVILVAFLFIGQALLGLFNVDISSFAVAGALRVGYDRSAGISFDCRGGFVYHFVVVAGGI